MWNDEPRNSHQSLVLLGFCELIPSQRLRQFDERELELVICGIRNVDVNDWKQYTRLKHCTPETPQVVWFWQVRNSKNSQFFVQSSDRHNNFSVGWVVSIVKARQIVTIRGWIVSCSIARVQDASRKHWSSNAASLYHSADHPCSASDLPKTQACFNRIDIPALDIYQLLCDKLSQAVEETCGIAVELNFFFCFRDSEMKIFSLLDVLLYSKIYFNCL